MVFDKSKFLGQYKAETGEHLANLNQGLLKLEKEPGDRGLLEAMMREAHTLKGSSMMMGYPSISQIGHGMENGLQKALEGKVRMAKSHFDVLFKCLDAIEPILNEVEFGQDNDQTAADALKDEVDRIFRESAALEPAAEPAENGQLPAEGSQDAAPPADGPKATTEQPTRTASGQMPAAAPAQPDQPRKNKPVFAVGEDSIRVGTEKLDKLMNLSGELVISKIRLTQLVKSMTGKIDTMAGTDDSCRTLLGELKQVDESLEIAAYGVKDEIVGLRMVPVSYLFNAFPRAMRDLAQAKNKNVELVISGEDTQLDKTIIDQLKDPLMHLLRNAVDHGIEAPERRQAAGKPADGQINLKAYQQGSQVIIEVSDDGQGIDLARVKEQAVKKGIVDAGKIDQLAVEQVYQILFLPGFSTNEEVTDVSGRGVGLDVVREKIAGLKGMVEIASTPGQGSKFTLKLPLTLAISESLLIAIGSDIFALPIETVVETIRVEQDGINTVEGKEVITVRGQIMPLIRLNDLFGLPTRGIIEKKFFPVVVVQSVEKRIGLLVDQLMGRQEVVIKALGDPLSHINGVAGATILGDGRVILILDVPSIIEAAEGGFVKKVKAIPQLVGEGQRKKTVLLAEDAMSTAMLEKSILEAAGFAVVIARDGQEAAEKAGQEKFDLVITDILMPRLDGFQLTSHLKKDQVYKDIPVIVVTTRESDADKRKGLEAGADAYLLKSEFTSDTLLETIERLIG